jgi:putative DNA modification/repair radical SAM protein
MNRLEKLSILSDAAKYDICASTSCPSSAIANKSSSIGSLTRSGICHSFTPDGRCVSLFKVLMTNRCIGDCKYCTNNCEARRQRVRFEPEELTKLFLDLYEQNYIEGLFLSSGVDKDCNDTQYDMVKIVENLREEHSFGGYIHLKILPGANRDLIRRATELANRVSINLEAPNRSRFSEITSTKDYSIDLLRRMRWVQKFTDKNKSSGQTTQFVVGSSDENDFELLKTVDDLYSKMDLKRSYFSAFIPVKGTQFQSKKRTPLMREHRLYECDFLMRKYGFELKELVFNEGDNIDLTLDPKMAVALENRDKFPVDVNDSSYEELIRVPGIGPNSAYRIIQTREGGYSFTKTSELKNIGVVIKRAQGFVKIGGKIQTNLTDFKET